MARSKPIFANCISKSGLAALKKGDRNKLNLKGLKIVESVDIDACFRQGEPNANLWDYYIGIERRGELYVEVHEVSEEHLQKLIDKANWLHGKIEILNLPSTPGRPLFVAPTKGITPFAAFGNLSRRLALHKITVIMKGDCIAKLLD